MKSNIIDKFNKIAPMNDNLQAFTQLMELPDAQFDKIYGELMIKVEGILNSPNFQSEVMSNISTLSLSYEEVESEAEQIKVFLNEIKEDSSLSENKKKFLTTIIEKSVLIFYDFVKNPRQKIEVKIERINSEAKIPEYAHDSDAGCDVFAVKDTIIECGETKIVKTGIKVAIPKGYEIQIRPRSGLSLKTGLRIANAPGTIDADYRGEIGVIMTNINKDSSETIHKGDKIAQLVISPVPMIKWVETTIDDNTERGKGGFGSTDNQS